MSREGRIESECGKTEEMVSSKEGAANAQDANCNINVRYCTFPSV